MLSDLLSDLDRQGDPTADDLLGDRDRRHVVERILTQLVDISVGLNSTILRGLESRQATTYRETFDLMAESQVLSAELATRLRPSSGMRNLLTHEYGRINLDKVAAAVPLARQDYGEYVTVIQKFLEQQPDPDPNVDQDTD